MRKSMFAIALCWTGTLLAQPSTTTQTVGLKPAIFKKLLNQQFSGLVTGQSKNTIGNFASLDLKDAEVSFAGNSILKNGSVFGVKATGAVSDGLFEVFTNSKLNTKIGMDIQYHFLALRKRELMYYEDSYRAYRTREEKIEMESALRIAFLEANQVEDSLKLVVKNAENNLKKLQGLLAAATEPRKIDSLRHEITALNIKLEYTNNVLTSLPDSEALIMDAENSRSAAIKKNETEIEIYGFRIGWLSISYKFQNSSFKTFSRTAAFDEQIEKSKFLGHEITAQYSYYRYSRGAYETFFGDLGLALGRTDNLGELDKVEITETEVLGTSGVQRTTTKKYDAYNKTEYEGNLVFLRLYGDAYWFLFKDNIAAIHLFPEFLAKESYKPRTNLGVGFLLSFKDKSDESANVNAELYYSFTDLFKVIESNYRLFERNSVGVRFSFPMNFKSKN